MIYMSLVKSCESIVFGEVQLGVAKLADPPKTGRGGLAPPKKWVATYQPGLRLQWVGPPITKKKVQKIGNGL